MKISFAQRALSAGYYPIAELGKKKQELLDNKIPVFDFGPGDDNLPIAPVILDALRSALPSSSHYPVVQGTLEFREAVRRYLKRRFGAELEDNQVIPVTGSKEAIHHLPSLFIEPGSAKNLVIGPILAYPPYFKGAEMTGGEYYPVEGGPEQDYLIELEELPEEVLSRAAIVYLNYPHNPTGAACDKEYFARQLETAEKHSIVVVSDECYADIYFGSPPPSILELTSRNVLAFHSLSKRSGMTGFRSGFVAGDPVIIEKYRKLRNALGTATPEPILIASIAAWDDDAHVEERRRFFGELRESCLQFFDSLGLEYYRSDASFYLWIKAPEGLSAIQYTDALMARGVITSPSHFFGDTAPEWFRVSLVLSPEECSKAFKVWKEVHEDVAR